MIPILLGKLVFMPFLLRFTFQKNIIVDSISINISSDPQERIQAFGLHAHGTY